MPSPGKARITAMGSYLPEKRLTNADLEAMVDTSDEWIFSRTGVKERRIAAEDEYASTMGIHAANKAIENAGISADEIELIICATATPDYASMPCTAALIEAGIEAPNAGAVDIEAACSGHVYALSMAKAYVDSGIFKTVLVVSTEKFSSIVDYKDRTTCVLFGDGASAAVVQDRGEGLLLGPVDLNSYGKGADCLRVKAGGCRFPATAESVANGEHFVTMNGREIFKHAVREMESSGASVLAKAGLTIDDVKWLVPHQANVRIIDAVAKRLKLDDSKVFKECVRKYGNNSAASVAIALDELTQAEQIQDGEHLLMTAFGGGLTYGAILLTKTKE